MSEAIAQGCPACAQLRSELAQVQLELDLARAKIASLPEDAIDNTEFLRRVEVLIARCKREAYGRIICPLCKKLKFTPGMMRVHLRTAHREILIAPKATFD